MDIGLVPVLDGDGNELGEDLATAAGDFTVVESTGQHQRQLIMNAPGEFKQNPAICVGAPLYIDDEGAQQLQTIITQQLMLDGQEVVNLTPNLNSVIDNTVNLFENAFYPG